MPYCHMDWAWTHTRRWHELRYNLVLEEVITYCKEMDDFRWHFDNYSEFVRAIEKHEPGLIKPLKNLIEKGQIEIAGPYAGTRNAQPENETFIRNMVLGQKKFRELFGDNISPVFIAADVGIGHSQMPQLLKLGGYRYYRGWRPGAGMDAQNIPSEFFWQGLDGSEILTSRGIYAKLISSYLGQEGISLEETLKSFYEEDVSDLLPHNESDVLWLAQGMDDNRPFRSFPEDEKLYITELIKNLHQENINIKFGLPSDYFKVLETVEDRIPVVEGVIDPTDVCYEIPWHGQNGLWPLRKQGDKLLVESEMWHSLASILEDENYPWQKINSAWEKLLLCSAHATQWLFDGDYQEIKHTGEEVVFQGQKLVESGKRSCLNLVKSERDCITLFNPNPCKFSGCTEINVDFIRDYKEDVVLVDNMGEVQPTQIIETSNFPNHQELGLESAAMVVETEIPATGYRTFYFKEAQSLQQEVRAEDKINNGCLELTFQNGFLNKIIDLITGNDYPSPEGRAWNEVYLEEMEDTGAIYIGPITGRQSLTITDSYLELNGPLVWLHVAEGEINNNQVKVFTKIYKDSPVIQFAVEINHNQGTGEYVAGFPAVNKGDIYTDIPFGVEERNLEANLYFPGNNDFARQRSGQFWGRSWVSYEIEDSANFALLTIDGDKYYCYDQEQQELKYILLPVMGQREGTWEERIAETRTGKGKHKFEYGIRIGAENWQEAELWQVVDFLQHPVTDLQLPCGYGPEEEQQSFIACNPDNVVLSAFYQVSGTEEYILRVYETAGRDTKAEIKLPSTPQKAEFVDFNGQLIADDRDIEIKDSKIIFEILPWKIINVKLEFYVV